MKRILGIFLAVCLCLSLSAAALADCCYGGSPSFSSTIYLPTSTTVIQTGTLITRTDWAYPSAPCTITQTPCAAPPICIDTPDPCAPFLQVATVCCDNYKKINAASAKSKDWAKYALGILNQVIQQTDIDWKVIKTKIHTPSNNGWVEMNLRNSETGEELYCVMNIHTRGDGATSNRVCTFTYGHLVNPSKRGQVVGVCWEVAPCFTRVKNQLTTTGGLRLADYPSYYLITPVGEAVEVGIAHFVYWLSQDIDHSMSLESLAAAF